MTCPNAAAIVAYLRLVLEDGDYRSDWLTHTCTSPALEQLGRLLAAMIGG